MDQPTILAAVGGLAAQLLNLMELPNIPKDRRPSLADPIYWLPFLIGPALGGFLGYLYAASGYDMKPILSVHIGISAPLILRGMATAIPTVPEKPHSSQP